MERNGWELLAVYHSHPRSPAQPSATDVDMAYYPDARQVIVSLAEPKPRLKCFTVKDGVVIEEGLSTGRGPSRQDPTGQGAGSPPH